MVSHINDHVDSGKFDIQGSKPHTEYVRPTYPWGEVGFRFKVLPKVLVAFEVA